MTLPAMPQASKRNQFAAEVWPHAGIDDGAGDDAPEGGRRQQHGVAPFAVARLLASQGGALR